MFATYPPFKHPLQLDPTSTVWTGVELLLATPSLLLTVNDPEPELVRTFLVHGWDARLIALCGEDFQDLLALQILVPPSQQNGPWTLEPVARVEWRSKAHYLITDGGQCFDQTLTASARPVGPLLRSMDLLQSKQH